ncbi:MAG TPA: hypothetical protein VF378_12690, partial [Geothrix sp.]
MKPAISSRSTEKNQKSSFFLTLPPWSPPIHFDPVDPVFTPTTVYEDGQIQGILADASREKRSETGPTTGSTSPIAFDLLPLRAELFRRCQPVGKGASRA